MTYRDTVGRVFTPGVMGDIPTGRLVWVDQVHGNDTLAVRERMTVPFKTLTAAKNAAQPATSELPGDTIMVLPGKYNEKNLLKNGVNWHFLPGAKVTYDDTSAGGIFDTSANGTNGAVTSFISGYGEFRITHSTGSGYIVNSAASGSYLVIQGRFMDSYDTAIRIAHAVGTLKVHLLEYASANSDDAVALVGAGTDNQIRAYRVHSSGGNALYVTAGSLDLSAHLLWASTAAAVSVEGGSGEIIIQAYEIYSGGSHAVYYYAPYNPKLRIIGARIKSGLGTSAGRAVHIPSVSNNALKLKSCVLLASSSADYAIYSALDTVVVEIHGETVANKDKNEDVVFVGGNWIPNQSIS